MRKRLDSRSFNQTVRRCSQTIWQTMSPKIVCSTFSSAMRRTSAFRSWIVAYCSLSFMQFVRSALRRVMKRRYSHTARDRFKPFLCWSHTAAFEDSLLRKIESCPTFGFHVRPTDHKKLSPVLSAKPALQRQFNCSGKTLLRNSAALISEQRRISCCFLFSFFLCFCV